MRHVFVHGLTVALALAVMPTVAAAQQRAEPSASTPPTPGQRPPPVLGREVPWRGGSIPPGYAVHRTGRGFVIGGLSTFLGSYVRMAIAGGIGGEWRLILPVVGPFVVGVELLNGTAPRPCGGGICLDFLNEISGIFMIATGITQASAVAMLLYGALVDPRPVLRYRWAMTPGAAGAPLGLTLSLVNL